MIPMDDRLARLAIDRLLHAYAKGEQSGQVDWEDLDDAFAAADAAVLGRYQEILKGVIEVDAPSTKEPFMNPTHRDRVGQAEDLSMSDRLQNRPTGPHAKYIVTITADPELPGYQLADWLLDLEVKAHLRNTLTTLLGTREATASAQVHVEDADE